MDSLLEEAEHVAQTIDMKTLHKLTRKLRGTRNQITDTSGGKIGNYLKLIKKIMKMRWEFFTKLYAEKENNEKLNLQKSI